MSESVKERCGYVFHTHFTVSGVNVQGTPGKAGPSGPAGAKGEKGSQGIKHKSFRYFKTHVKINVELQ